MNKRKKRKKNNRETHTQQQWHGYGIEYEESANTGTKYVL